LLIIRAIIIIADTNYFSHYNWTCLNIIASFIFSYFVEFVPVCNVIFIAVIYANY